MADLSDPWGSSFISDEELIITEKTGKIKIVNIISEEVYEIEHNLNYFVHGQGGLLDIFIKMITYGFLIQKIEGIGKQAPRLQKLN